MHGGWGALGRLCDSHLPAISDRDQSEATACCPWRPAAPQLWGDCVVQTQGGERGVQRVPACSCSCPTTPTRLCLCTCMSNPTARMSTASSKVGGAVTGVAGEQEVGDPLTPGHFVRSYPLQLLLWPQRLQPVPGRRPRVQVCVVCGAGPLRVRGPVQQQHLRVPAARHHQGEPPHLPGRGEPWPGRCPAPPPP